MKWTIVILSLLPLPNFAQINLELQGQFCSFQMNDLKNFQNNLFTNSPVPIEKVTSFPPYFGIRLSGSKLFNNQTEVGLTLSYASTGGRVQYKDFSGNITGDQLSNSFSVGILARKYVYNNNKLRIGLAASISPEFTSLTLKNSIQINSSISQSVDEFNAFGIVTIPSVIGKYSLNESLFLTAEIGYHLTIQQNTFRWSKNQDIELIVGPNKTGVKPNWDGVRVGIGIGYLLKL